MNKKKDSKFNFPEIPVPENNTTPEPKEEEKAAPEREYTRITLEVPVDLYETLRADAYWQRLTIREITTNALDTYYEGKEIAPLPESVKQKARPGRKPKKGK